MDRRKFLKFSALAACGAPLAADAWEKPRPILSAAETWVDEPWKDVYLPDEFITVKPSVHRVGTDSLAFWWRTADIATGWVEVSQDGGATWRKCWYENDGIRSSNTTFHMAVMDGYDCTKPLKYRAVSRPIAEFARFGQVRYSGETIPGVKLDVYRVSYKYRGFNLARSKNYTGEVHVAEGEILPIDPENFKIVMLNNIHHQHKTLEVLLERVPENPALVVFNGSIIDFMRSEEDMNRYLNAPLAYYCRHLKCPVRFIRGLRETMGPYARYLRKHIPLQDNAFYGAFSIGRTRLLMMDTPRQSFKEELEGESFVAMRELYARQNRFLLGEVAGDDWKKASRRIAFSVYSPETGEAARDSEFNKLLFDPIGKDLSLLMAAGSPLGVRKFIPAGGIARYPVAVGGGKRNKNPVKGDPLAAVTVLSVRKDSCEVTQIDCAGEEVYRAGCNH